MYNGCDIIHIVAVMSSIGWGNETGTVGVRSDIVVVMSDIVDFTSKIKSCDVIKGGCDVI